MDEKCRDWMGEYSFHYSIVHNNSAYYINSDITLSDKDPVLLEVIGAINLSVDELNEALKDVRFGPCTLNHGS